jgi:hypothetical protein
MADIEERHWSVKRHREGGLSIFEIYGVDEMDM